MSQKSNNQGRAYEYICLLTLNEEINKIRKATIIKNSSYNAALNAWNSLDYDMHDILTYSAKSAVATIFDLEPLIVEKAEDEIELLIQPDEKGKEGDVRDILVIRQALKWEIGFSIKHNHFAVKHSRLATHLDFGEKWYGKKCSEEYWKAVKPIFDFLSNEKKKGTKWRELENKEDDIYLPLLNAFMNEIKKSNIEMKNLPKKMVEYLLGEFDFYKVISIDNSDITQIQTFNIRGTLNKPSKTEKPKIKIPIVDLPTRIVEIELKPNSKNTVELYLDNGWQFSFRIHNASEIVEPSLKFDIQIQGMPTSIISIDCHWSNEIAKVAENDVEYNNKINK